MVRIRSGWLVALLALGLGAAACKKNDDKAAPSADKTTEAKTGGGAADKSAPAPAPAAGGAISGVVGDDLALIPVDSDVVIGVNFAQLQQSALWKQYVAPKLGSAPGMDKFKALCGFDPLDSLKSLSIGVKGVGGKDKDISGTVVVHGYDKSKAMACFDKDGVKEAEKDGSKVVIDGDVVMVTEKTGQHVGFTFVNNDTALAIVGPDAASKDSVKKVAAGGSALRSSQAFVEMFQKLNSQDTLWFVLNGNSPAMAKASAMGIKMKALFGSLAISDGLAVNVRARLGSADEATNMAAMAKGQLGQAKQFFDKMDVSSDGPDVKFDVAMSKEKLTQLVGMVAGMMGGMMGGMSGGGMGGP
jgi:hypothetical protein